MCLHFDKRSDLLWDGPLISPTLCTAGHIVQAGPAPCLCIVELSIDFFMEISWGPLWRLRWPTIRITSPPRSMKLRLLVPQYSGWYMDFTWTDKHCGAVIWTRNQRDLQLLFMFMQISYVIWYALNLDIIRIVYVFKLACTLIIH